MRRLGRLPWRSLGRWWIVGLAFYGAGLGLLYLFIDVLRLPLLAATLMTAEITVLLRFLINDRWVFGHRFPAWVRLWQFHVASAGGAVIWWLVANALPRFGVHYLVASTAGTACSVFFSMFTNFLWIWRGRKPQGSSLGR
jgi:putative flippase GtrA